MDPRADHLPTPSTVIEENEESSASNIPLSPANNLLPTTSKQISNPGSDLNAAEPVVYIPVPYNPIPTSNKTKKPSIERYLGKTQECFVPVQYTKIKNDSSTQGSSAQNGLSSASNSTLKSFFRSITEYLNAVPNKLRKWSFNTFHTWAFGLDAWAKLMPWATQRISSTGNTAAAAPSDVIKTVPMPLFPIRVFYGKPPPFSLEAQKRKMRWRYRWRFGLAPELIQEPDTELIRETVQQYIDFIAPETETISVEILAQGAFNQAYNVTAENKATGFRKEYVFRVALPIYPYYKLESDVATTEFVRHTTTIPVPIIYAFDSSPNNKLGFEWMLMEKVQGVSLHDTWETIEYSTKQELTKTIAKWMDQLSRLSFDKIGSLYCRQRACQMEFHMGPALYSRLYEGDRLLQDVSRGPFESLRALYDAVLDSTERHMNDPRHGARHKLEAAMREEGLALSEDESSDGSEPEGQKCVEEILADADVKDRRNERHYGVTEDDLEWLPDELRIYRDLLLKLCSHFPASQPMVTMLTHPDLSTPNIFVDNSGAPVALIDWERARIEPVALFNALPHFLTDDSANDPDYFYVPPGSTFSTGRKGPKLYLYGDEGLAQMRARSERNYTQVMEKIQLTHLRALYREELKCLQSPMFAAFERDAESLEQQLMSRVYWPENAPPNSAIEWAAEQLGESIVADSDEGEEDASEDQEEPAERGEMHEVDRIVVNTTAYPVDP